MNMIKPELVGIVGFGDLGSRIGAQLVRADIPFVFTDTGEIDPCAETSTVDESGVITNSDMLPRRLPTVDELFEAAQIIHWCAPVETHDTAPVDLEDGMLFLHDSVMENSVASKRKLNEKTYKSIQIVHFLMNTSKTVVVANESDDVSGAVEHIKSLSLNPQVMSASEHDTNMAHSQAPFAVLHEMLSEELSRLASLGLLTPSGEAMSAALTDRSANWTEATLKTLLSNPALPKLLDDMKAMLGVKNGSH